MDILIRDANTNDLDAIFAIEKRSYPPELQAPHEVLTNRLNTFGIRVAELEGKVVGFYTSIPIFLGWNNKDSIITQVQENRNPHYEHWFEQYKHSANTMKFNTLYVASTAVMTRHQGEGIGKLLVQHSINLARDQGLEYRASVLRLPRYAKVHKKMSPEEYIQSIKLKKIKNPILGLYISLGFELGQIIPHYESDRTSKDFGIFAYKKL